MTKQEHDRMAEAALENSLGYLRRAGNSEGADQLRAMARVAAQHAVSLLDARDWRSYSP